MWRLLKQIPSAWFIKIMNLCFLPSLSDVCVFFHVRCFYQAGTILATWSEVQCKECNSQQNIELSGRHGAQLLVWEPLLCVTLTFVPLAEGRIKTLSQVECWAYASFVLVWNALCESVEEPHSRCNWFARLSLGLGLTVHANTELAV